MLLLNTLETALFNKIQYQRRLRVSRAKCQNIHTRTQIPPATTTSRTYSSIAFLSTLPSKAKNRKRIAKKA